MTKEISNGEILEAVMAFADKTDQRFNDIDQRFCAIEKRLDNIESKMVTKNQFNSLLDVLKRNSVISSFETSHIQSAQA